MRSGKFSRLKRSFYPSRKIAGSEVYDVEITSGRRPYLARSPTISA